MKSLVDTSWIQPQVSRFHDRNQQINYMLAVETARRIVLNPALIAQGRAHIERRLRSFPATRQYDLMWLQVLDCPPEEIARRLIADNDQGDQLRASRPVFEVISPDLRRVVMERHKWPS